MPSSLNVQLLEAARDGNVAQVERLLLMATTQTPTQRTPTRSSTNAHHRDMQHQQPLQLNVNCSDAEGRTPLFLASWQGHVAVVRALLKWDDEQQQQQQQQKQQATTAADVAATSGEKKQDEEDDAVAHHHHFKKTTIAVARGGGRLNVNCTDVYGATPLHKAAFRGHYHVVQCLLLFSSRSKNSTSGGMMINVNAATHYGSRPLVRIHVGLLACFSLKEWWWLWTTTLEILMIRWITIPLSLSIYLGLPPFNSIPLVGKGIVQLLNYFFNTIITILMMTMLVATTMAVITMAPPPPPVPWILLVLRLDTRTLEERFVMSMHNKMMAWRHWYVCMDDIAWEMNLCAAIGGAWLLLLLHLYVLTIHSSFYTARFSHLFFFFFFSSILQRVKDTSI
jgi:Ankyrin repeats (many copies)